MAYNFKKINDVPVVEVMKDNLNVFIEDGGKMAKIPANKMIPEDVALKSDIPESIPVPATAEVGQVIAVKAVDENGKPTEWEVKKADGGDYDLLIETDGNYYWGLEDASFLLSSGNFQDALSKCLEGKPCKVGFRWSWTYGGNTCCQVFDALAVCGMTYSDAPFYQLECIFMFNPGDYFPYNPLAATFVKMNITSENFVNCEIYSNEPS